MHRKLSLGVVALLTVACDEPTNPPAPSSAAPASSAVPIDQSAAAIDLAVIGDVPYGDAARAQFPAFVDAINGDPTVRVVVHVGDTKSGSDLCSDAILGFVAEQFQNFADPLVYAIGDNEWTDCHRANNGAFNPLERLAKVRELYFPIPGRTLGGRNMAVQAQAGYPENQLWVQSRVTFAALHILGSNNGLEPWFGASETPEQTAAREAEVAARIAANLAWLEHAFAVAHEQGSAGIALFFQADLWNPFDRALGTISFSGHTAFVQRLAELATDFDGPVLLLSGDSHDFRVDEGVEWFSLYGATPLANVTQIIVDRSIEEDTDWLRLRVDPGSPNVFSWEQVFVPSALVP
jgi:hypothetical protein